MLIPYSTDAPIYYFPWMTIALIVANVVTFVITGMGLQSEGWLLTYGRGLHPLEWIAYNFLHFGVFHLIGNMFFLWSFGIVVEGKLGWQKYLLLYLSIGIIGGMIIQTAMLWDVPKDAVALRERNPPRPALWDNSPLFAQEFIVNQRGGADELQVPGGIDQGGNDLILPKIDPNAADPDLGAEKEVPSTPEHREGAGGASLIIYGLMAIVLIWAPRNEILCLWLGFRTGVFEFEYLYFCGFYIVTEVLSALFSFRGFEFSSEAGHAVGAMIGLGVGTLFVKRRWVDCENWDVFSIISGKHNAAMHVGGWHTYYAPSSNEDRDSIMELGKEQPGDGSASGIKKKKKKAKPKLVELDSVDPFESIVVDHVTPEPIDESFDEESGTKLPPDSDAAAFSPPPIPPRPQRVKRGPPTVPTGRVRQFLFEGEFQEALTEYLEYRSHDSSYHLPQEELRILANGLFKAQDVKESAVLLAEYIHRFPGDANRQRVKLSVLYVKFLKRPTAALKLLAAIDTGTLPDDYRSIYQKVARQAQQMIAEGRTDEE